METAVRLATALQAYSQKNLQKSATHESNINKLLEKTGIRSGSFDNLFPTMFSLHGLDIRTALDQAVSQGEITKNAAEIAVAGFNRAMKEISDKYPVLDSGTFNDIKASLDKFVSTFNIAAETLDSSTVSQLSRDLQHIKSLFKKPYIVAYSEGSADRVPSIKLIHNSFSNLRGIVNPIIKKHVLNILKERKITNSKLLDGTYLTTKIINWGHTRTGDTLISGKLIASLMSLKSLNVSNDVLSIISKDFIQQTGQEKTVIKLHHGELTKGDPNVLSLVISSNLFQSVIVQNRIVNQQDLGQLETRWSLLEAVNRSGAGLLNALGVKSVQELGIKLLNTRSSPSPIENIASLISNSLIGITTKSTKKTVPILNSTKPILKSKKTIQVKSTLNKSLNKDSGSTTPTVSGLSYSLASLQLLINTHLQDVISANMGTGNDPRILNYQTGRFAASAKVERMSQSREGMITAFYSYMKNPYQTFEPGYRQGSPKTRDPKLLIAGSIRDIAASKVGNRMRAVLL